MTRFATLAAALLIVAGASAARGQEADEVRRLRERVDSLEDRLEAATLRIEELQEENKQLRAAAARGPAAAPKAAAPIDAFAKGATFRGNRTFGGADLSQEVTLVVMERDGTTFEGRLTIVHRQLDRTTTVKVTGSAPIGDGAVKFKSERKGLFEQAFDGSYAGGELGFRFSGKSDGGSSVSGAGKLRLL